MGLADEMGNHCVAFRRFLSADYHWSTHMTTAAILHGRTSPAKFASKWRPTGPVFIDRELWLRTPSEAAGWVQNATSPTIRFKYWEAHDEYCSGRPIPNDPPPDHIRNRSASRPYYIQMKRSDPTSKSARCGERLGQLATTRPSCDYTGRQQHNG